MYYVNISGGCSNMIHRTQNVLVQFSVLKVLLICVSCYVAQQIFNHSLTL